MVLLFIVVSELDPCCTVQFVFLCADGDKWYCLWVCRADREEWTSTPGRMLTTASIKPSTASASCSKLLLSRFGPWRQQLSASWWRCEVPDAFSLFSSETELPAPSVHEEKVMKRKVFSSEHRGCLLVSLFSLSSTGEAAGGRQSREMVENGEQVGKI